MASVSGEVAKGAASGAAAGSVVPGWGTALGAAIGAIGGFIGASGANRAEKATRRRVRRATKMLKPSRIMTHAKQALPQFRSLVAGGVGPGIESRAASNLARSGFTDTGTGEAIRGMSLSMPGVVASQGALQFATELQLARASNLLGAPSPMPMQSEVLRGIAGGLSGGLGTWLAGQRPPQQNNVNVNVPGGIPSGPMPIPSLPGPPQWRVPMPPTASRIHPDQPFPLW